MMQKINYLIVYWLIVSLFSSSSCSKEGGQQPAVYPRITVEDLSMQEGTGSNTTFNFVVTLDKTTTNTVTLSYSTSEGTAKAGEDFVSETKTLEFKPGEQQKNIAISVVGDDIREGDETFSVVLSNANNGALYKSTAVGTIENDDTKIAFANTGYDAPTSYPGYTLVWADEFNSGSLNTSNWSFENGDGCPGVCGWGNNELEWYQPNNLYFQDGKMIIEARKENAGGKNYTSSKIVSRDKKAIKFGRIDFRAILPRGQGIWPAFWMMPQNNVFGGWPRSGEIDIMEYLGHQPSRVHGTLHFGPGPGSTQLTKSFDLTPGTFNDAFHVFSLEWKQDTLKWLVDNVVYSTYTKADVGANNYPFNEQFFMIVNLAVGGNWPGNPNSSTYFPQWFIVDYIRVYQ